MQSELNVEEVVNDRSWKVGKNVDFYGEIGEKLNKQEATSRGAVQAVGVEAQCLYSTEQAQRQSLDLLTLMHV